MIVVESHPTPLETSDRLLTSTTGPGTVIVTSNRTNHTSQLLNRWTRILQSWVHDVNRAYLYYRSQSIVCYGRGRRGRGFPAGSVCVDVRSKCSEYVEAHLCVCLCLHLPSESFPEENTAR